MSNYYGEILNARKELDTLFKKLAKGKIEFLNENMLILDISSRYQVSEKILEKRIKRLLQAYEEIIFIDNTTGDFKKVKK